jgi:hypothetical protein
VEGLSDLQFAQRQLSLAVEYLSIANEFGGTAIGVKAKSHMFKMLYRCFEVQQDVSEPN